MSLILVGLPVLLHTRRFHFDRGRRWNAIEHLILQAVVNTPRTAGWLAGESGLPRRVVLEVLVRLMRAGWVELRTSNRDVTFHPTARGYDVAGDDELPATFERLARKMSYAVDLAAGSVFRRRDLTLLHPDEWTRRTEGRLAVEIQRPTSLPPDAGRVGSLLGTLFNEDEQLVRVDPSDRPPVRRLAQFAVRGAQVENWPGRGAQRVHDALVEASRSAAVSRGFHPRAAVAVSAQPDRTARPERTTSFRRDDLITGGGEHEAHLKAALRAARKQVVIHSTFLNLAKFEALLPEFRTAAAHGCRVDIMWGKFSRDGGLLEGLRQAEAIERRVAEAGLAGAVSVQRFSSRSHAKLLVADDGRGGAVATVGSCNWLYSGFDTFEVSARLRDPRLVADVLFEAAELARPPDGQIPDLTITLAQWAREQQGRAALPGSAKVRVLAGGEHDDRVLAARDHAESRITVLSHRLGVTAKPAIAIPLAAAVRERNVTVELFYGRPSGPVQARDATDAGWTFREQGVSLTAIQRPPVHAKVLAWDDDHVVVTSLNWLSADATDDDPRQELGVSVSSLRLAALFRQEFSAQRLTS